MEVPLIQPISEIIGMKKIGGIATTAHFLWIGAGLPVVYTWTFTWIVIIPATYLIIYSNLTTNIGRRVKPSSSSRDRTAKLQTTRTISTETRTSSSTPRCRCATRMPTQHRSQSPSASSGQQASQRHCRSIFIKTSILFPFFKPITYLISRQKPNSETTNFLIRRYRNMQKQ